ncbi:MAG: hypothetical protein AAGH68_13540 [Pseudomonadota bacterium]
MKRPVAWMAGVVVLGLMGCASGNTSREPVTHGDWSVFAAGSGSARKCWAATTMLAVPVGYRGRSVYALVTAETSPAGTGEFAVINQGGGWPARRGTLNVGAQEWPLQFEGETGWLLSEDADRAVRAALAQGQSGRVTIGTDSMSFSVEGFASAVRDANRKCSG